MHICKTTRFAAMEEPTRILVSTTCDGEGDGRGGGGGGGGSGSLGNKAMPGCSSFTKRKQQSDREHSK